MVKEVLVDPYRLFGFTRGIPFSREDLRRRVKELVIATHPDKAGGSHIKFQTVMECYTHLLGVVKTFEKTTLRVDDATIRKLREEREHQAEEIGFTSVLYERFTGNRPLPPTSSLPPSSNPPSPPPSTGNIRERSALRGAAKNIINDDFRDDMRKREGMTGNVLKPSVDAPMRRKPMEYNPPVNGSKFDVKAFNRMFEETRAENPLNYGHGEWLKQTDPITEREQPKLDSGIPMNRFQEEFERQRQRLLEEKRLVHYTGGVQGVSVKGPRVAGTSLGELVEYQPATGSSVRFSNGIVGVDIREAHEGGGVIAVNDPRFTGENINRKITMDYALQQRNATVLVPTADEEREMENERIRQDEAELERMRYLELKQREIDLHYQKVRNRIEYRPEV